MVLIRLTLNHSFNTHHLGKSQNIQKSFCADVARKVCDCVVIETANKILRKKSRAYFLLHELLFLFCEFLTQLIKYLEEKPYVGKTSSGIQNKFSGDVSRKFCYCVKIEATNKILGKKSPI